MSDLMLHGVLNMPIDLWNDTFLNQSQRHSAYIAASKRIYELTDALERIDKNNLNKEKLSKLKGDLAKQLNQKASFAGASEALRIKAEIADLEKSGNV